jgi:large subunit ribosomal protein L24
MAGKVHVKKGDTVYVLSGKDRGQKGKVLQVIPEDNKVIIEGVNMIAKHAKPRGRNQQGGIIKKEAAIHASNVLLICPKCGKPAKVGKMLLEDGKKARVCKKCSAVLDISRESRDAKEKE